MRKMSSRLTRITKDEIPAKIRWANISPDKKRVVFAKDLNLYVMSYEDYEKAVKDPEDKTISEIALTTDGEKDFGFGMPRTFLNTDTLCDHKRKYVMGNWSPNGRYFVATLSDQREVQDLWVINSIAKPRPTLETYKYQMPGEAGSPIVHLYLFDLENAGKRKEIRVDICSYTIGEDSVKAIIEERLNTSMETRPLAMTDNGKELIHWSERDGWAHLYLYDAQGNLKNRITKGPWHVDAIVDVDSKNRVVYFKANAREKGDTTPYYEHLYRVNLNGSGLKLITPGDYFHLVSMDKSMRYIVDNYSRVNTIPATALYDNQGNRLMTLEESDFSQLFMAGYKFPEPFSVKAADGVTDLYGVMYKPFDFDSTKVYPVINVCIPRTATGGNFLSLHPDESSYGSFGASRICRGVHGT